MVNIKQGSRPISLTIICLLCLAVITLTILAYIKLYNVNTAVTNPNDPSINHYPADVRAFRGRWDLIMIFLQMPIITGVVLMFRLKQIGLWIFLIGKIIFFSVPFFAGTGDDVFGLMMPIFLIESATFFVLFGKRIHYMN